jgi:regulator of ribonuclease activity A
MASPATFATADLVDEGAGRACEVQWRSFGGRAGFAGEIVTVDCVEDNGVIKEVVAGPGAGRVLVVDGHGSLSRALVGDRVAGTAVANGWEGLVINGAVRDVSGLTGLDLGVLALGTIPTRCAQDGDGSVGPALAFGAVEFLPGQFLVADRDGVVVCPVAPGTLG